MSKREGSKSEDPHRGPQRVMKMKAIPRSEGHAEEQEAPSPIYFDPISYVRTPDYDDETKYDPHDPLGLDKDHPSDSSDDEISSCSDTVSNSDAETPDSAPEQVAAVAENSGPVQKSVSPKWASGQLTDEPADEKFWENYEQRMGETSQGQCLFPPMVQAEPSTHPDLSVQPPDVVLSAAVLRGTQVVYLCRWDNYFAKKNASVRGRGGRRSMQTGRRNLYFHVSKEQLTEHCPQLLQTFDDYNPKKPESPVDNSVQKRYRDGEIVMPSAFGRRYKRPQHIWHFPNPSSTSSPPSMLRAPTGSIGTKTSKTDSSSVVPLFPSGSSAGETFLEKIRAASAAMGVNLAVEVPNDGGHQRVGSEAGAANLSSKTVSEQRMDTSGRASDDMGGNRALKVHNDGGHQRVGSEAGAANLSSKTVSEQRPDTPGKASGGGTDVQTVSLSGGSKHGTQTLVVSSGPLNLARNPAIKIHTDSRGNTANTNRRGGHQYANSSRGRRPGVLNLNGNIPSLLGGNFQPPASMVLQAEQQDSSKSQQSGNQQQPVQVQLVQAPPAPYHQVGADAGGLTGFAVQQPAGVNAAELAYKQRLAYYAAQAAAQQSMMAQQMAMQHQSAHNIPALAAQTSGSQMMAGTAAFGIYPGGYSVSNGVCYPSSFMPLAPNQQIVSGLSTFQPVSMQLQPIEAIMQRQAQQQFLQTRVRLQLRAARFQGQAHPLAQAQAQAQAQAHAQRHRASGMNASVGQVAAGQLQHQPTIPAPPSGPSGRPNWNTSRPGM